METFNLKHALVTDAASEPVTLADVKLWLGVDYSYHDSIISQIITSARIECEKRTARSFISTTWDLSLDYFPPFRTNYTTVLPPTLIGPYSDRSYWLNLSATSITLPRAPAISVTSITYYDSSGVLQTLSSSNYVLSLGTPGQITPAYGQIFPVTQSRVSAVVVRYLAGFGTDGTSVPANLKTAIMMLCAHWYRNREAVAEGSFSEVPLGVDSLLASSQWGYYG